MSNRMIQFVALVGRVTSAEFELERYDNEGRGQLRGYEALAHDANAKGLAFRQQLAEAIYRFGGQAMRHSRAFDNCFENGDGDQVVAHLVKRARELPELEQAIARDWGGQFPAQWLATAAKADRQLALI